MSDEVSGELFAEGELPGDGTWSDESDWELSELIGEEEAAATEKLPVVAIVVPAGHGTHRSRGLLPERVQRSAGTTSRAKNSRWSRSDMSRSCRYTRWIPASV